MATGNTPKNKAIQQRDHFQGGADDYQTYCWVSIPVLDILFIRPVCIGCLSGNTLTGIMAGKYC
jgi:hypothetical protein